MDITAPNKLPKVRRRRGFLLRLLGFMFAASMIVFVAVAAAAAFMLWKVSKDLPDYEVLAKYEPPVMTRIHANDGNMIAEFSRERRIYVPYTAIPDRLISAFLAAEDKTFYQHGGIDIQGILRAVFTNFGSSGGHKVGASTITQQVAKNFLLTSDQTMERKLKEVILSIRIERAFLKQILELYPTDLSRGGAMARARRRPIGTNRSTNSPCRLRHLATLPKTES
jgi:penicillin-binding protein 1A